MLYKWIGKKSNRQTILFLRITTTTTITTNNYYYIGLSTINKLGTQIMQVSTAFYYNEFE